MEKVRKDLLVDILYGSGYERAASVLEGSKKEELSFDELIGESNLGRSSILPILEFKIGVSLQEKGWIKNLKK